MRFSIIAIASITIWCGCASMIPDARPPRSGTRATGEPLVVVEDMKVWRSRDNVGEVRVEDETGQRLATADVYATRTHTRFVWYPVQGKEVISDEDFFRIAGEPRALEATQRWRESNLRSNRRGRYLLIGGAIGAVAGLFAPGIQAKALITLTGVSVGSCGLYLMLWSHDRQQPESHVIPVWEAYEIADRYNRKHGLSVSRSF